MRAHFQIGPTNFELWLARACKGYHLHIEGEAHAPHVRLEGEDGGLATLVIDGRRLSVAFVQMLDETHVHIDGHMFVVRYRDPVALYGQHSASDAHAEARAPMPGTVIAVHCTPGATVKPGDELLVIESMKLETTIRAPNQGVVEHVHVEAGQTFDRDAVLVTLAAAE